MKKVPSNICNVNKQTQIHVLNNCSKGTTTGYLWRHNSILYTINFYLSQLREISYPIFIVIEEFSNPTKVFRQFIPDMVLVKNKNVIVIEFTGCIEINFEKSRQYIIKCYEKFTK